MDRGILVGCDEKQEWLLPWWWHNYKEKNSLPVAFADFGMSETGRNWCRSKGALLSLDLLDMKIAAPNEISPFLLKEWEQSINPFWESREAWFKKPFALQQTPFFQTAWFDLDCEILASIDAIYQYIDPVTKIGLMEIKSSPDPKLIPLYNAGVVVFEKNCPLLDLWTAASRKENDRFLSDQDALSSIIHQGGYAVGNLPDAYNWLMCRGVPLNALVLHWAALWGKAFIRKHGGLGIFSKTPLYPT